MKSWLRGSCVENYMHGVMRIGKMVNAKVMNYDLRDLNTEMNKRTYNLIEINKLSGWNIAPLRK